MGDVVWGKPEAPRPAPVVGIEGDECLDDRERPPIGCERVGPILLGAAHVAELVQCYGEVALEQRQLRKFVDQRLHNRKRALRGIERGGTVSLAEESIRKLV